jgi:outer membrane protein OmpA-like peptidoglycan-associated protein
MNRTISRRLHVFALGVALAGLGTSGAFAQSTQTGGTMDHSSQVRSVASGQKTKLKGTIVDRNADTFVVRDEAGYETEVLLTGSTDVKSKGGFFKRGRNYDVTNLLRGLNLEVEGRGNAQGQLEATKIRFDQRDLMVARSIDTRVTPVEGRVSQVEAENRNLAGQVDELNEVSKQIKGDVEVVRADAARANAGVSATNERISSLDDYDVADQTTVFFKVNRYQLTEEGKAALDQIAQKAIATKGYVIEVAGFTDTTGSVEKNRVLSQRRADAVVRYLQENYDIPLRRMITPYGYGEMKAAADNTTREGREQNRRVEVKILVSRGLTQSPSAS